MSYFEDRIYKELGVTPDDLKFTVKVEGMHGLTKEAEIDIFTPTDRDDIRIRFWDLNRNLITYPNPKADDKLHMYAGTPEELEFELVRLNPSRVTDGNKYLMPKGGRRSPVAAPTAR